MIKLPTALYGRTSKDDPKKVTIEIQQQRLHRWGKEDDGVECIAGTFWDEGVSGKIPLAQRPEGGALVNAIRGGIIKCVAVVYADRFGRTLLDGLQAARDLERMGVDIVCVEEGWDGRRKDSPLNFQLRLLLAEEEHRRIAERMEGGKERAIGRDNAPPTSAPTFGYRVDATGQYVIYPPEAAIVSRIFEMAAMGTPGRQIHAWVLTQDVRAGRICQKRGREATIMSSHSDAKWHYARIGKILRNRTYTGVRVWRGKEFPCPAIIGPEMWEQVQSFNARNAATYTPKVDPSESLVSGLFKCSLCDGRFYFRRYKSRTRPRKNPRKSNTYSCEGHRTGTKDCPSKLPSVDLVDSLVWGVIEDYLNSPEEMIAKAVQGGIAFDAGAKECDGSEDELLAEIQEIELKVQSAWAEQQQNDWPMAWVSGRLNALNAQRKALEKDLASVRRARLESERQAGESLAVVPMIAAARAKLAEGITRELQYEIIRLLVPGGVIRTIGTGREKVGELTMQLRWGEQVQAELNPPTSVRESHCLQFPIVVPLVRCVGKVPG